MLEEWKDIIGYEGLYQVSNLCRVKSIERTINVKRRYGLTTRVIPEKILCTGVGNGYNTVSLWKNNKGVTHKIAVLAATAFIPNPLNLPIVNHLDGIKTNDWLSNYEWASYSRNTQHAVDSGNFVAARGEASGTAKLKDSDIITIRAITDRSNRQIAKEYGVSHSVINHIKSRKTWKHIP